MSNAMIAHMVSEARSAGQPIPDDIRAFREAIGDHEFNKILAKGDGSVPHIGQNQTTAFDPVLPTPMEQITREELGAAVALLEESQPKINASFTGLEGEDPVHQLVEVTLLLDQIDPHAPEDEMVTDRLRRILAKTPEQKPLSETELVIPAPVMADLLARFMKHEGDQRYNMTPCERPCAGCKWQVTYSEGMFTGFRTKGWELVQEATNDLMTINSKVAEAYRRMESAEKRFKMWKEKLRELDSPVPKPRAARLTPEEAEEEDNSPSEKERDAIGAKMTEAKIEFDREKATFDKLESRLKWCKNVVEQTVPESFSFSLADLASGRVRIGDSW